MGEEIRFTQEELSAIAELQRKYQDIVVRFGQLYVDKANVEERLIQNATAFDNTKKELESLKNQEINLAETLKSKYGEGQLDFQTGVFTPAPKPPAPTPAA